MGSSLALRSSGRFPIPSGVPSAVNLLAAPVAPTAPLSFDDLVAALQGGNAAPAAAAPPSSASPGTLPGSNGGSVAVTAPVTPAAGGGLQICLPRMFSPPGPATGMGAYRRRGVRGMGGRGLGDYLMSGAVRLIDGTVINDPANTVPTPAQCLPYQCGADPSNQAARYWCSYYGRATTRPPCWDPSCAPWKPTCTPPLALPIAAPTAAPAVYPYGPLQIEADSYVPARCNGSLPRVPGGARAGANGAGANAVCFSLASPVLWGTVAALGLGIWAAAAMTGRRGA